ncbi:MAG: BON domain-containing protein [Chitinophagaceae bacterium]|nr:BON domain-containing protein [Chitinophagaceae bacterium]
MTSKQFICAAAFAVAIFFSACGPKDQDMTVTVTESVHSAAPNVNSNVSDGVVTLTGTVSDEATKMAAEDAAKKISGVKSVVNNIVVTPATTTTPVTIAPSGALQQGVIDATKDYPEVTATVNDQGEIVVTGQVTADRWKRLKVALDALNPKRVNADSLIIK